MTPRQRAIALAAVQVMLALAVSARLAWDRMTLPRVWALSAPVDPSDPLRGRYVRLRLEALDRRTTGSSRSAYAVEGNRLVLRSAAADGGRPIGDAMPLDDSTTVRSEPVAFFIPENIPDPSQLVGDQQLWVEVTVPPDGLPRPIRTEVRTRRSN